MAASVDQFGKALVASGLMSADDVKSVWNALPHDRPKEGRGFAKLLIDSGKLTEFQAQQILDGRGSLLVFGEYVVLQEIGVGGMGQVYKAQHKRMKRIVALKVMSQAAMKDGEAVKRFQREVEAAARLEHPNIVTAFDAGRTGAVNYLVMQFVDGGDLSDQVKRDGPLSIERAVDCILQAARGLAFAHGAGVIHRDIKPANLLCDNKGVVKILDMGLARIDNGEEGLTGTDQVMGTVDYMSPEQGSNTKSADARSDIYSLGCTFWYLLTGRKTYEGDSMIARLMGHRDAPLPSLVKVREDVPWSLEQVFHRMIAKHPDDRFQTMEEVAAALEPFSDGGSGGASSSGVGSSIGRRGGPRDSELSAFLKTVGPTPNTVVRSMPVGTHTAATDVTAKFAPAEVETDPKSNLGVPPLAEWAAALGLPPPPAKPQAKEPVVLKRPPPNKQLLAAGVGGLALLVLLGLWFLFRDRTGSEAANVSVLEEGGVASEEAAVVDPALSWPPQNNAPPTSFLPTMAPLPTIPQPTAPPVTGDYALFAGHVTTPLSLDLTGAVTLEAYITPSKKTSLPQTSLYAFNLFNLRGGEHWSLMVWTSQGPQTAPTKISTTPGKKTHVAAVCTPQEMQLYVDGVLAARQSFGGSPPSKTPKLLEIGNQFSDQIDEIRISRTVRYTSDFKPQTRFTPDADTLLLYHCDEGFGTKLLDASGNRRDGVIDNPVWVRADGSPIPPR